MNLASFAVLKMKLRQIRAMHSGCSDVDFISHPLNITETEKGMEQMLCPSAKEETEKGRW